MRAKVSFVILSHNDAEMVVAAVKSIQRLKTRYAYDIYVVDNGSRDGTPDLVKKEFKDVKVIKLPKNIGTAAYDAAIKKSKSEYIFFTGCDVELREDMIGKLVGFLEKSKNIAQAAPKYIDFYNRKKIDLAGTWLSRSFYSGTFKDSALGDKPAQIPYMGTGLIRRDVINKFGYLFDEDYFFYGEDVDLGLRIMLIGLKVYYLPDAVVYHKGSMSRSIHKPAYLAYLMERNLLTTFFKILSGKSILLLLPYVLSARLMAIIMDVLTLKIKNAFARIKAIFWVAFNFGRIIEKREKLQRLRKFSDKEMFKVFSERCLF